MLFTYKYLDHDIVNLQKWIDFLFINVWCEAQSEFSFELFNGCKDFKAILEKEAWKEVSDEKSEKAKKRKKAIDHLTGPISVIYDIFKDELTPYQRQKLKNWYSVNKRLDNICAAKKSFKPITKKDLSKISKNLAKQLYDFHISLYTSVLDLAIIRNQNGTLENHYQEFVKKNNKGVCPFCGIEPLQSYEMKGHEAYDHYLPKENYPLFAINFRNLVPTCQKCNSKEKSRKSPILKKGKSYPTKCLFPYSKTNPVIDIQISVNIRNYTFYEHKHLSINFKTNKATKEVSNWWHMYGLEMRYKDVLTNNSIGGKYWLVELLDEITDPEEREKILDKLPQKLENSKFKGQNFLKVPFLQACRAEGLF